MVTFIYDPILYSRANPLERLCESVLAEIRKFEPPLANLPSL